MNCDSPFLFFSSRALGRGSIRAAATASVSSALQKKIGKNKKRRKNRIKYPDE
jgi:hypothetical protein